MLLIVRRSSIFWILSMRDARRGSARRVTRNGGSDRDLDGFCRIYFLDPLEKYRLFEGSVFPRRVIRPSLSKMPLGQI